MSFIRPEIARSVRRWAETAVMAGLALWLGWLVLGGLSGRHIALSGALALLAAIAGALAWIAARKALVRQHVHDPGVVSVAEGRVAFFGPHSGGFADFDLMSVISLVPGGKGPVWIFSQSGAPDLEVPASATGAEHLPRKLAALPGFPTGKALQELRQPGEVPVTLWQRDM